jgi:hypothetical protein
MEDDDEEYTQSFEDIQGFQAAAGFCFGTHLMHMVMHTALIYDC